MPKIKAQLPQNKLDKLIKRLNNIFEKKNFTFYKKLQSLIRFLSFVAKVVLPGRVLYNVFGML